MKAALIQKDRERQRLIEERDKDKRLRDGIVSVGQKGRSEYYGRLRAALDERQRILSELSRHHQKLEHLAEEAKRYQDNVFPDLLSDLRALYSGHLLTEEDWRAFEIAFKGNTETTLSVQIKALDTQLLKVRSGSPSVKPTISSTEAQLGTMPLVSLQAAFDQLTKEIVVDQAQARKLKQLNERIATREIDLKRVEAEIERYQGSDERMASLLKERGMRYEEFFKMVIAEEAKLQDLYQLLAALLQAGAEAVRLLRLVVLRTVDLNGWASRGEELIDLRKSGTFKGKGSLSAFAREQLLAAWQTGTAAEVSSAMSEFRSKYDTAIVNQSKVDRGQPEYPQWTLDVGRWLYSTDHISINYSFEYGGVPLSQLSPGTRGIVLLLLYLALDLEDRRPLIIDQPEENLDPRTVFTELVGMFRAARSRRQVIMVTHNANLVVNTDVDQVIIANCEREGGGKPPTFVYRSGGLENPAVRASVCEILEGGEAAFLERAKRLRVYDHSSGVLG